MLALFVLGIHLLAKGNFARACHFSAGFLCVWYWIVGVTSLLLFLPFVGFASVLGATSGYAAFSNSTTAAVAGLFTAGGVALVLIALVLIVSAMSIIGAHLLRAGTNYEVTRDFNWTRIVIGFLLILMPALVGSF